ncbi:MAG: hypothetical protein ACO36I_00510 [Candidatus Latescibacterota bacterium]|jgi:hypothetical protein
MQVRPVEFQESFARLPVEQARQQHVLQREPDLARDQSARVNADAHLRDLGRPVETSQTEGLIIQADQNSSFEQRSKRRRQSGGEDERSPQRQNPQLGRNLDIIV